MSQRPDSDVMLLRPSQGWGELRLTELWSYRELLGFLIWRDIKVRYKQTALGAAWAVIQPVFAMVVFSLFFGKLAGISSEGLPYPIFAYAALVPWTYFSSSVSQASNSLVQQASTIKKVYFPRLCLPLAAVLSGLVDFAIAFAVLLAMMVYYGIVPTSAVWILPALVLLTTATALAVSLWLAALNVRYRDIRHAVPFLIQIWLFATPVAYPSSLVPDAWRFLYGLNPMVGVVDGFRWALLGQGEMPDASLAASMLAVSLLTTGGLYFFRRTERTFADLV